VAWFVTAVHTVKHHGWMYKALYERTENGETITRSIDIFFPETAGNEEYESHASALDKISELAFADNEPSCS
jgi:hypothetical protein